MTICYPYLLSLLSLLLITHWTNSASLRHSLRQSSKWLLDRRHSVFIVTNESTTSEPVLSRRRPLLPLSDRRRRWSKDDEVEIPIADLNNFYENSTITEINYPLLKQDIAEINQTDELTTISINEELSQNNTEQSNENISPSTTFNEIININTTESEISPINEKNQSVTDTIDNPTTIETINNDTETSSIPISLTQTIEETTTISQTEVPTGTKLDQDTAIILFDFSTIPPSAIEDEQTSIDPETKIVSDYNTTVIDEDRNTTTVFDVTQNDTQSPQGEIDNTTIISDAIQTDAAIISDTSTSSDVIQNDTSTVINDEEEYSNETIRLLPAIIAEPVCDRSCQCSKECPYGFELINDTCKCDPPCKNYQCFGNDTCTVTSKGQPVCRPENGSEHDRPIRCYQPRDAGYHDANIRYNERWYYDPDQDACHLFLYRGFGGNENNFPTLHECHLECITCAPAPDSGTCLGYIPMWYYDHKKNQCSEFKYSGCKGNDNKFLRKKDCVDTCVTRILNL